MSFKIKKFLCFFLCSQCDPGEKNIVEDYDYYRKTIFPKKTKKKRFYV